MLLLFLIPALGAGGYFGWSSLSGPQHAAPPQMTLVRKETFIHEILERGSVDSAVNVEVRCQVESAGGLTIISIVPEGTIVKKGDLLVELDSSTLTENVIKQRIAVNSSIAKVAQSEADYETAVLSLKEYKEGKFKEAKQAILERIYAAEQSEQMATDTVAFNQRLLQRGYITETQAKADVIAYQKAKNSLETAKLELDVLNKYTYEKSVKQFEASIVTSKAKLETDKESLNLDQERLKHLEEQLVKCKILAPQDGQVVYFLPRWGGEEDMMKEGKKVVERQILIKLPDPTQMQVKGLVNEANIRLVKPNQKARIRLEAFPDQSFEGVVTNVNDYPEQGSWMGGTMSKEYQTTVSILNPPEGIKPGLTAEALIVVNEIHDALTIPVQAVFSHKGAMYCITYRDGVWEKIPVKVGPTNDKQVVVLEGLEENDLVVLGARLHRDKVLSKEELRSEKPSEEEAENGEKEKRSPRPGNGNGNRGGTEGTRAAPGGNGGNRGGGSGGAR